MIYFLVYWPAKFIGYLCKYMNTLPDQNWTALERNLQNRATVFV